MSRAEKFIQDYTMRCSNIEYTQGVYTPSYQPWLTPDQARKAVEIAREEMIEKTIGWIREIYNHHHIIRYSDSCEPPISELTEWFKNYMKEGVKDE